MLAEKGLSAHEIADIAIANEPEKVQSAGAKRQARYRERKALAVTSDVTSDVTCPPKESNSNPRCSEPNGSGGEPPADPMKELFDVGVSILTAAGHSDKQARSLIGKWRKEQGEAKVLAAFLECRGKAISNPVEWLQKRLAGPKYRSSSGYEYRGDDRAVMREAEKRADWNTYYAAKANLERQAA